MICEVACLLPSFKGISDTCFRKSPLFEATPEMKIVYRMTLSANMSETATPRKFSVEGEQGLEDDERTGTSPRWTGDRGDGEGDPTAVYGGVQTEDRPGGRRVQDAGRGRGVVAARGVVLLASHDVARGAGARGTGRGAEEAGARAAGHRSARQEARRARAGDQPVEEARRTG